MKTISLPAIWLIILIVGLPQLSETVYTPSLPDIAKALATSDTYVEYTLSIYLLGFAIGTLFWGKISDKQGRKPSLLAGLFIFILGCIGCYFSSSIEMLMLSRLIQAFGGSAGSVLGQAICRDSFHGAALGKIYSTVGSALALFPALGPLCGGVIAQHFGWANIFVFLIIFTVILIFLVSYQLSETHPQASRKPISILNIIQHFAQDKKVIGFGLLVAACNGISFSYFAEGPFYFIETLGLSPSQYGLSFVLIAIATMLGGIAARYLHNYYASKTIMLYGLCIIALTTSIASFIILVNHSLYPLAHSLIIAMSLISQMTIAFGICMTTSNALALALTDYKHAIGTASSLFGCFYYSLISLFTFCMGFLHNGTLLPMPLYFFSLSLFMLIVYCALLKD